MSTRLRFPRGSTTYWLLRWSRGGAADDLTGAVLGARIKASPETPDEASVHATTDDSPQLEFTWRDDAAGLAILRFKAGATADQFMGSSLPLWEAWAELANGDVLKQPAHRGVLLLEPITSSPLSPIWGEEAPVADVSQILAADGSTTPLPPAMTNYVHNRYDLTGLGASAPGSTKLAGLSAEALGYLNNGAIVRLFFTGSIMADYRLRANTGVETESPPWRILCDNAATRLWELVGVWKQGTPCVWNPDTSKFHQQLAAGTGEAVVGALAQEAHAFALPD